MKLRNGILLLTALLGIGTFDTAHADLKVFGYSNFVHSWQSKTHPSFDQVNTNLMMQKEDDRFKFFTEIEFQHAPKHDAGVQQGTTPNATGRGAISVERAWAEVNLAKYAQLRAGVMLNTTLYVDNHYPSIVTPIDSPMLSKNIFQEQMEGAQLRGELPAGFSYIAWLDRKQQDTPQGLENYGGHLYYENTLGDVWFKAGLLAAEYHVFDTTLTTNKFHNQFAKGAELQLTFKGLTLWSEIAQLTDKKNSQLGQRGFYTLLSYSLETKAGEFIPFVLLDSYRGASVNHADKDGVNVGYTPSNVFAKSLGLTYRPIPVISFKSEWTHTDAVTGTTIPASDKVALAFVYFYL